MHYQDTRHPNPMSQPNFNKTLTSLYSAMTEVKHLRAELEEKKTIITQLQSKIAVLEAQKGVKQPEVQSAPQALAFTGNWYEMAQTHIASYVNPKTNRPLSDQKKILAEWKRCIVGAETNPNVDELWTCICTYVQNLECKHNTKCKKMGNIKTITNKILHIPEDHNYQVVYNKAVANDIAEKTCKCLSKEELAFLKVENTNEYCTLQRVRDQLNKCSTFDEPTVLVALLAFHGNRLEDWKVKYGKNNYVASKDDDVRNGDRGFYDPDTKQIHLFYGKTHFDGERVFKLHAECVKVIEENRKTNTSEWLVCQTDNAMRFLAKDWFEREQLPSVLPSQMRHLYETHIRYVEKMNDEQLDDQWKSIGHTGITARKLYGELYKNLVI